MLVDDSDDLVAFEDVRIIRSTAQALLCGIGDRSVWLPRGHLSGKLWCVGDRGKLFIRRWIAHDRRLIHRRGADALAHLAPEVPRSRPSGRLRLVREGEGNDLVQ